MPKLSRGRMPAAQYSVLQGKHGYLLGQLTLAPLIDILFERKVLDEDDVDRITTAKNNKGKREGVGSFLEILRHSGNQAYPIFLEVLENEEVAMHHVAKELRQYEQQLNEESMPGVFSRNLNLR